MQALVLSDIHGDTDSLERILRREQGEHDLVLVLGDITDNGLNDYLPRAKQVVQLLNDHATFVKAVPGNMDNEDVLKHLIENRINLHKQLFSMEDYDFIGFGGGSTPFDTPFEPDDAERGEVLRTLLQRTKSDHRAIVSHQPPKGTAIDRTNDGTQAGSAALRNLLDDEPVDAVFSGHIHEARGTDTVNGTLVVNPGPVNEGYYARVALDDNVRVELKE